MVRNKIFTMYGVEVEIVEYLGAGNVKVKGIGCDFEGTRHISTLKADGGFGTILKAIEDVGGSLKDYIK